MIVQPGLASVPLHQGHVTLAKIVDAHPKRRHRIIVRLMMGIFTCLAALTLTLVGLARTRTVPQIKLPQQVLPSGLLPSTANCLLPLFHRAVCHVELEGKEVDLTFDTETGRTQRIGISGQDHLLGDLIRAWGTPTGLTRYGYGCSLIVFWGTSAAQVYTCVLHPNSPIAYIEYTVGQQPQSAWQGFSTHN